MRTVRTDLPVEVLDGDWWLLADPDSLTVTAVGPPRAGGGDAHLDELGLLHAEDAPAHVVRRMLEAWDAQRAAFSASAAEALTLADALLALPVETSTELRVIK